MGDTKPRAPKSPKNVASTFFNTVNLLPKDLMFEQGGAKIASYPGRHLTSLCPCRSSLPFAEKQSWSYRNMLETSIENLINTQLFFKQTDFLELHFLTFKENFSRNTGNTFFPQTFKLWRTILRPSNAFLKFLHSVWFPITTKIFLNATPWTHKKTRRCKLHRWCEPSDSSLIATGNNLSIINSRDGDFGFASPTQQRYQTKLTFLVQTHPDHPSIPGLLTNHTLECRCGLLSEFWSHRWLFYCHTIDCSCGWLVTRIVMQQN